MAWTLTLNEPPSAKVELPLGPFIEGDDMLSLTLAAFVSAAMMSWTMMGAIISIGDVARRTL